MSDKYYVTGCVDNGLSAEVVEDEHAEFWTLYERDSEGLSEAIIDCVSRKEAETAMAVYVERDRLNEQVRALAAEVQSCRQFVAEHLGPDAEIEFAGLPLERSDAVLREVGALAAELAIDGAIDAMVRSGAQTFGDCVVAVNGIRAEV